MRGTDFRRNGQQNRLRTEKRRDKEGERGNKEGKQEKLDTAVSENHKACEPYAEYNSVNVKDKNVNDKSKITSK